MQTQADYLIGRFGGIAAMARALGHRNKSTVQGWKERGIIPTRQHPSVLSAGASLDPPLEMREFFESMSSAPHIAAPIDAAPSEAAD